MIFPELARNEVNSMKASPAFLLGLIRRLFNKRKNKVFVIGFHKTGTSSLGKALQILGYKVCGRLKEGFDFAESEKAPEEYILEKAQPLLERYEAFQDTPWFIFYKQLYERYPDAYFILTLRESDIWLASLQKHFGDKSLPYHEWIYGTLDSINDSQIYLERYNNHNSSVREFFKNNPKFLEFRLGQDGWKELAGLLGQKIPKSAFPHTNKGSSRNSSLRKIKHKVAKLYYNR
jgi:hypothetical protein